MERKEEYYKFLFYNYIENKNLDALKMIPTEYIPNISLKSEDIENYCKNNNFLAIKQIHILLKNNILSNMVLLYACKYGQLHIVKYLYEEGLDFSFNNHHPLRMACLNSQLDIVKFLVEHGSDVDCQNGYPLMSASYGGHFEIVKYLVENGADIQSSQNYSVQYACKMKHFEIAKYLIKKGAYFNRQNI